MSNDFLKRNNLYYSDTMDLTTSIQSHFTKINLNSKYSYVYIDSFIFRETQFEFCWNYNLAKKLDNELLEGLVRPVINGIVTIQTIRSYGNAFDYIVIARKDTRRSGMRFLYRGCDENGFAANFAEAEAIVIHPNNNGETDIMSYLQVRGSIPVIWTQEPDLNLNPKITPLLNDNARNLNCFSRHTAELLDRYKKVIFINLVDKKNYQGVIGNCFTDTFTEYGNHNPRNFEILYLDLKNKVDYTWFDFHAECKKMKYQNIQKLLNYDSVSDAVKTFGYTHIVTEKGFTFSSRAETPNYKVITTQEGCFRVNCIDSLDRTNVINGVFARLSLHRMLYDLGLKDKVATEPFEAFDHPLEVNFRHMWGDVGDSLSRCYSGTGALKSDFTRLGKRTVKGAIQDGINSCTRFYINNFKDGYHQDCHDYFLGHLHPQKHNMKDHSVTLVHYILPIAMIVAYAAYHTIISNIFPDESEISIQKRVVKGILMIGLFCLCTMGIFKGTKAVIISKPTRR
jgi:hypothetical protein